MYEPLEYRTARAIVLTIEWIAGILLVIVFLGTLWVVAR